MTTPHNVTLSRFENAPASHDEPQIKLTLIVSGTSDLSARAIANARHLCDTYLAGRYHLLVVDLHEDPANVLADAVLATPTLVKSQPLPVRTFVGDLSRTSRVLLALGLPVADNASITASTTAG